MQGTGRAKPGQLMDIWTIVGIVMLVAWGIATFMFDAPGWVHFLLTAGVFLIMPGLITDTLGLLLLIPPVRHFIAARLVAGMFGSGDIHVEVFESERGQERRPGSGSPRVENGGPVIEGDFERIDERRVDPRKGRPNDKS